jgi:O-antigen/teichoic acid export membrane protein
VPRAPAASFDTVGAAPAMSQAFGRLGMLQAAIFVTASTYFSYGISIVVSAIVARALGPSNYGQYAYLVWLIGLLVVLANHGLTTSGIRFVSESLGRSRSDQAGHVWRWLHRQQRLSIGVVLALFVVWMLWLSSLSWHMNRALAIGVVVVCVYTKSSYLFDVSMAKGYGNFRIEPLATMLTSLLSGVAAVLLAWHHADVNAFIYLFTAASLFSYALVRRLLKRANMQAEAGEIEPALLAELRSHLLWTGLLFVSASLSTRAIETYLLASRFGPEQVAYYSIAGGLMRGGADLLTVGLAAVLLPAMSRAYGAGGIERVRPIFADSLRYLTFMGLLLAGSGALWADPLLRIMYGSKYLHAIPVLQSMLICMGVSMSDGLTGTLLTSTGQQRVRAWILSGNLAVAAALAIALVPRYGLVGATLSYVISKLLNSSVVGAVALHATGTRLPIARLLRLLAAALVAAATALAMLHPLPGMLGWIVAGLVYAAVLLLASILLRSWTAQDVDLAMQLLGRMPYVESLLRPLCEIWRRRFTH